MCRRDLLAYGFRLDVSVHVLMCDETYALWTIPVIVWSLEVYSIREPTSCGVIVRERDECSFFVQTQSVTNMHAKGVRSK